MSLSFVSSQMKRTATLGALGSVAIGLLLFWTPLISCGCLEPWQSFLAASGVTDWQDRESLNESVIEKAARPRYVGKPIAELDALLQDGTIPSQCRQHSLNDFDCDFWLMDGLTRQSGFEVKAEAGSSGIVTTISVKRVHRLFGYRL